MADVGERFGPFGLTELLMDDGAFQHWRATRDDGTRREPFEVEIRLSKRPSDEVALAALRAEYNTLRILSDARIVRPVSFFASQAAVALEFQDCLTLEELIEAARRRLVHVDLATATDIGLEVAHALRHVHSIVRAQQRIVHGALTSREISLNRSGEVLLAGVGRPQRHLAAPWRPPEDARSEPRTAATDLWHLGALIAMLATASKGVTSLDLTPRLRIVAQESPTLAHVLERCMADDPQHRYPHDGELIRELYAVFSQLDAPSRRRDLAAELLGEQEPPSVPPPVPLRREEPPPPSEPDVQRHAGIWTRTGAEATDPGIGVRRGQDGAFRARAIDDEPDTDPDSPFRHSHLRVVEADPSYSPRATDDDIWVDQPPDVLPDLPMARDTRPSVRSTFTPGGRTAAPYGNEPPNPSGLPRHVETGPVEPVKGELMGLPVAHWVVAITMTVAMTVLMLVMLENVL